MEMTDAAEGILSRWTGLEALARCEWKPPVDPSDADQMRTLGALFRAHGRALAVTPALGILGAAMYDGTGPEFGARTFGFQAHRTDDSVSYVTLGRSGREVLLDVPGEGVLVGLATAASEGSSSSLEPGFVRSMVIPLSALQHLPSRDGNSRPRRVDLVRIAIAHEMLGVCDAVLKVAVTHANDRTQFGKPIGSFQSIQHLLADAAVDARALDVTCRTSIDGGADAEGDIGLYLKALAGRSARRVLQATLQTLGAIGFSWEHDHHRFTRRVLVLDALGGTTEDLFQTIGAQARGGAVWRPVHLH